MRLKLGIDNPRRDLKALPLSFSLPLGMDGGIASAFNPPTRRCVAECFNGLRDS